MIDTPQAFEKTFTVSRETLDRLQRYASLLTTWQRVVQLVGPNTLPMVWSRHFADSAQLLRFCPPLVENWIDMGSGAGFPGLVVAVLAADPKSLIKIRNVFLVESDTRKAAFLKEVSRDLGVTVDILSSRIESSSTQANVGSGDVVSARACAPLVELLSSVYPYWKSSTLGLFLKGKEVDRELSKASKFWQFELDLKPSLTDTQGRVLKVWGLKPKKGG